MIALLALLLAQVPVANIRATKHNLSAQGGNVIHAETETEVCVFCHTPHGAYQSKPIWNRNLDYQASALYTLYSSSTLDAIPSRPNGATRLCLSCHDGVLALGAVMNQNAQHNTNIQMANGVTTMPQGNTLLGLDLHNDHPVSIVPDTNDPEIQLPPAGDAILLQEGATPGVKNTVQCTSCHEPHLNTTKFLRKDNLRGAICTTCHTKPGWIGSRHEASLAPYPAAGTTTVGDRACLNCHTPHNAVSPARLHTTANLSGAPLPWAEENVCLQCHRLGGTGVDPSRGKAAPDIQTQFNKFTHHPVELTTDVHQPEFTARLPAPEPVLNTVAKHVECADCHNPHQVQALPQLPSTDTRNVHTGMRGIAKDGSEVIDSASRPVQQWEICFRCHGDSYALTIPPAATRPPSGSNKRLEFQPTNRSFHPVGDVGKNQSAVLDNFNAGGQLQGNAWDGTPLSRLKTVLCTDCHNNESTADVQGSARNSSSGPKGPHGSSNARLLRANLSFAVGSDNGPPFGGFNANNFALCFRCHDVNRLTGQSGSRTNFFQNGNVGAGRGNLHWLHLIDKTNANCIECHYNIHSNVEANNTEYVNVPPGISTHLINFAPTVKPFPGTDPNTGRTYARPAWGYTASGDPYCFLRCHGQNAMDGQKSVYRQVAP
ncbi:MAG TPA: cytochrome c3 family protein [Myxococcales bacterium]